MADKKLQFGQKASEYVPVTIDSDDIWIKNFQMGETRVRLLEPTGEWMTYREHFDPGMRKSFPCTEDTSSCIGCTSEVERVRNRPRKYAFNALNDKGQLNCYKVGVKLKTRLEGREQRSGTLLDRDYTIIRTGTTMDTTEYDYEYGDRYEIPFTGELHDIQSILAGQYLQALENMGRGEAEDVADEAHATPVTSITRTKDKDEPKTAVSKTMAAMESNEPVDDWPLSRLKAYLDNESIDYGARATRTTLVPLVEAHIKEAAGF